MLAAPRSLTSESFAWKCGDPDRFRLSSWVCIWTFFAAGIFSILKPRGVLLFALLLLCGSTPPWGSGDLGGKVLVGFLGCADCDVLKSSGVTCCAVLALLLLLSRVHRGSVWDVSAHARGLNREGWVGLRHKTSPWITLSTLVMSEIKHATLLSADVYFNFFYLFCVFKYWF